MEQASGYQHVPIARSAVLRLGDLRHRNGHAGDAPDVAHEGAMPFGLIVFGNVLKAVPRTRGRHIQPNIDHALPQSGILDLVDLGKKFLEFLGANGNGHDSISSLCRRTEPLSSENKFLKVKR
jgi:hypothetical protein